MSTQNKPSTTTQSSTGGKVPVGDGNEAFPAAKRQKPTDRSLPSFSLYPSKHFKESTESLASLEQSYKALQDIERKFDWTIARKKAEYAEAAAGNRATGLSRTLRLHLNTKVTGQPWQTDSLIDPTNLPTPQLELQLTTELLPSKNFDTSGQQPFSKYIKRVHIEVDRDATLFEKSGPFEWHRPAPCDALSLCLKTSEPLSIKIYAYIDHTPEIYAIGPELSSLINLKSGDRITVLQALWYYIKSKGLIDEDEKKIRADERMHKFFSGQQKVPFHHLPEYMNRSLVNLHPVLVEYTAKVDIESAHAAFDLEVTVETPLIKEMEEAVKKLKSEDETIKELITLDQEIAQDAFTTRETLQKRTFFEAFSTDPVPFIKTFISSQASDLEIILNSERGKEGSVGSGPAWREEIRQSEVWKGDWVQEGATVFGLAKMDEKLKSR